MLYSAAHVHAAHMLTCEFHTCLIKQHCQTGGSPILQPIRVRCIVMIAHIRNPCLMPLRLESCRYKAELLHLGEVGKAVTQQGLSASGDLVDG